LSAPGVKLAKPPTAINGVGETAFLLAGEDLKRLDVRTQGPAHWKTSLVPTGDGELEVRVLSPPATTAQEGRIFIQLIDADDVVGEMQVPIVVCD
jgi:hypothetical protein